MTTLTQQVINVGAQANDGSGDSIRLSYEKCNNNFTQLFQAVSTTAQPSTPVQWINAFEYQADAEYVWNSDNSIDTDTRDVNGVTVVMVYDYNLDSTVNTRTLRRDTPSGTILATQTYAYDGGLLVSKITT